LTTKRSSCSPEVQAAFKGLAWVFVLTAKIGTLLAKDNIPIRAKIESQVADCNIGTNGIASLTSGAGSRLGFGRSRSTSSIKSLGCAEIQRRLTSTD
jgi:hypothetical protein